MKKILLFLLGLIFASTVIGQTVAIYSFSQPAGTFTAISGGTVLGSGTIDDNTYANNLIGFTFTFRGVAYTAFSVTANGWLCMGTTIASTYTPISTGTSNDVIAPLARDLQGLATGELRYQTLGSAPNRTLVVQWLHFAKYGSNGTGDDFNFQVILNETTNVIDIVYGSFVSNAILDATPQVGLSGAARTDFKNRTTTTNWSATTAGGSNAATCALTNIVYPATNLTFEFAPPPPCVAPVAQPTALILTPGVTNMLGSFTASATADNYLVVRSLSNSLSATPTNGVVYTVGAALGGGFVDYFGTARAFTSTGLTANTHYYYYIFAANNGGCTGGPIYLTSSPLTGNIFTLLAPSNICGTKTVGATGADYVNLTYAMFALSNSIMTCPVTLLINSNYSSAGESLPIVVPSVLGSNVTNTLTIKPNTGVTASISGTMNAGMVFKVLNSNTIIDGSNTVGGTTQDLTIANTSTTTPQVLVLGSTGTTPITNCIVKNTIMINGVNSSSAFILSDGTTAGAAGYFNNITIQNNNVQKAYIAMYCIAVVAAGNGSGLLITGNQLNTAGANSIRLCAVYVQGIDGATVSNNTIGNIANTLDAGNITGIWFATGTINSTISGNTLTAMSGTGSAPRGIAISSGTTASNLIITGNSITNISTTSSGSVIGIYFFSTTTGITISKNMISNIKNSNTGGYMATAMYLASTAAVNANCTVVNNAIWDVAGYGYSGYNWNGLGMIIYSGFGYNVYFNTVYMNTEQTSATGIPSALFIYSSVTTAGAIDLRDNIFSTIQTVGTNRYAIYSLAPNTVFSNIDYNDYFTLGPNLGYIASINRATLADIQAGFGGNVNSLALNPTFVGTDLHPTNVAALGHKGITIAGVTTDITGAFRTNPPDIGAYQFAPNQTVTTVAATNLTTTTATLNGSITASNLTVAAEFEYGLTAPAYGTTVTATPPSVSGNTATPINAAIAGLTVNNTYHFRAKGTNGSLIVYGNDMTFSTAVPPVITTAAATVVGATFATMNGTINPKNASTVVSFEYGTVLGGPYPTPVTVPGTYSGNSVQGFSATLSGLVINTTYYFRAKAVNAVGTYYGTEMNFFTTCVTPAAPGAIQGSPSVCKPGTGYVYSVAPVPYAFIYIWTFPVGFSITSYPNSNSVTVDVLNSAVSGSITVKAQSDCGAIGPNSPVFNVTVNSLPVPIVTGTSPVCQFTSNNYTTQPGMTSYVWSATPNGTITANGNVASISWPTTGAKTVGVIYTNPATGCTAAAPGTMPVTVNAAPLPTISGNNNMCINSGYYNYTTDTGPGITGYVWGVSSGGTITAGQGTAVAQVVWNTPGAQYVTVNYNNSFNCSAPTATVYNVTVNGLPGSAGAITGSSTVCLGSNGVAYAVPPITNAISYVWSLPAGATIATGNGTNSITVDFATNAVSGDITVYGNSLCGNGPVSAPFHVTIAQLPLAAGPITGVDSVCAGEMGVPYSVAPVTNATGYVWNLPAGVFMVSGANTTNITVDIALGANSGNMSVYGTNSCGNGVVSATFPIVVKPVPPTPYIYAQGNTLFSNAPAGNQWYYEGAAIVPGTGQSLVAQYTGWYWDVVTLDGCASDTSNNIYMVVTGMNEPKGSSFVVYPVPNDGLFKLIMNSPSAELFNISISNNIGVTIYTKENVTAKGPTELVIDLRPIPSGIYTMIIRNANNKVVRKIMVNR